MGRVRQPSPDVVAHRGASAHRAEHTRGAYELALEQGADALECDVRVSRDGQLVCVHDRRIDRTSSGRGVVSELTVTAMSEMDFGSHRELPESADELIRRPAAAPEHGVLTLDELLGMVQDHPRPVRLFVETKHPVRYGGLVEQKLVALLARHGLAAPVDRETSPVLMMSFSQWALRRFRAAAPGVPTVLLFNRFRGSWRFGVLPQWADLAGPDIQLVREHPEFVARAAAFGTDTYCWTVDEPADVALCSSAGVRYVATNAPASTRFHLASSPALAR
ncbi:glycerophosphodiester phosphodiesterase [Saccharopolyspora sp. K220]|uniref:glycerophosphodiester phosphodiesterase n=1 Tax=Saccharopolyspora soli TaxID=2926618 RepID=UPI001F55DA52|nr:glycerophosphodiester phosphodiesterase family protein [Saccharopolyspora soli]MCI2418631.1 glycerophosphodiester phosphodiesterase [Saccharopolyspora soli]